jgi:putative transposase
MARKLRLEFAGACYHVINRGNYRRDLFALPGSAAAFERVLFECCQRFSWRLHAFVIMRNHFHLAVQISKPDLSDGMKWLQGTWAMRFNRFHRQVGRPFQGRYKALHVEPGPALARVVNYIHLNPVEAQISTVKELGQFRWCSLWHFLGKERPDFLRPQTALQESGVSEDCPGGWQRYLQHLGLLAAKSPGQWKERAEALTRGWCVGSEQFREGLKTEARRDGADLDRISLINSEQEAWHVERELEWERVLKRAAELLKIDLRELPLRKSSLDKVRLAAVLRARTGASNGWLALRLGMGRPASASQYVRRFRLQRADSDGDYQRALSGVKT